MSFEAEVISSSSDAEPATSKRTPFISGGSGFGKHGASPLGEHRTRRQKPPLPPHPTHHHGFLCKPPQTSDSASRGEGATKSKIETVLAVPCPQGRAEQTMLRSVRERPALAQSLQRALLMLCLLLFLGTVTTLAQKLPKSRDSVHLPAFSQFHPPGLEEIVKLQGMKYVRHMKGGWGFSGDSLSFEVNTTGKFAWKDKAFRAFKLSRDGKIIQAIQGYNTLLEVYSHRMRAVDIFEWVLMSCGTLRAFLLRLGANLLPYSLAPIRNDSAPQGSLASRRAPSDHWEQRCCSGSLSASDEVV